MTVGVLVCVGVRVEGNAVSLPRNLNIHENPKYPSECGLKAALSPLLLICYINNILY